MSDATARESVMMQVPQLGAFVRVLLPIRLTGGYNVTFGVWLAFEPADLPAIFGAWWAPEYRDLRVNGWLGNAIRPWGCLAAPVEAAVRDPAHTPYCERSEDPLLDRVLRDEWPHNLVLDSLAGIEA